MGDQMKTFDKSFIKNEGNFENNNGLRTGKWKGYAALISIVVSLIAVMFGTFIPLIVSSAIIALFAVSRRLNVSRKVLGYFVLFIIVGSLLGFAAMPFMQKGTTGNSVENISIVDEPSSQAVSQPASEGASQGGLAKEILIEDQNKNVIKADIVPDEGKRTLTVVPENSIVEKIEE